MSAYFITCTCLSTLGIIKKPVPTTKSRNPISTGVGQLGPAKATRTRQLGPLKCRTKATRIYLFRTEKRHILRAFNQECDIGFGNSPGSLSHFVAYTRKLGNRRSLEGIRAFKPSRGTHLLVLIILAGDIEMNPGPRSQCRQCKKYCKATDKTVKCKECRKCIHVSRANLSERELSELGSKNEA